VAVGAWSFTSWTTQLRERLCFRVTDRFVHKELGPWPLSVSSDRIALPAMRTFALLVRRPGKNSSSSLPFPSATRTPAPLNGLLRRGRISSSIGKTVWSECSPDGCRARRRHSRSPFEFEANADFAFGSKLHREPPSTIHACITLTLIPSVALVSRSAIAYMIWALHELAAGILDGEIAEAIVVVAAPIGSVRAQEVAPTAIL
jgi:hypothetical protein